MWPTEADLSAIDLLTPTHGWAVGMSGTILHFDGQAWQPRPAPTTSYLLDVKMLSAESGWIVGVGVLLKFRQRPPVLLRETADRQRYPMIQYPALRAATADFDGDDRLDLLTLAATELRLFTGRADGGFRIAGVLPSTASPQSHLHGLAVGDIDGDGATDLAVTDRFRGRVRVLRNHGGGSDGDIRFEDFPGFTGFGSPEAPLNLPYLIDFDNDGDLDLYLAREFITGPKLPDLLYRNDGLGHFVLERRLGHGASSEKGVLWGDLDGDLDLDAVSPGYNSAEMKLYLNQADRLHDHTPLSGLDHGFADGLYLQGHLVDFDLDGDLDLLMLGHRLHCVLNDGQARFTTACGLFEPLSSTLGNRSTLSAVGDLDHDGYPDVLLQPAIDGRLELRLFLRHPDGGYRDATAECGLRGVSGHSAVLADWDDDGDLDLFTAARPRGRFFENLLDDDRFLKVRPRRAGGNPQVVGSKVAIYEAGHLGEAAFLRGVRQTGLGGNSRGPTALNEVHFGTPAGGLYDIEVSFPGGRRSVQYGVAAGRTVTLHERALASRVVQASRHKVRLLLRRASLPLELVKLGVVVLALALACRLTLPPLAGAPLLRRGRLAKVALLGYVLVAGRYAAATAWQVHAAQLLIFATAIVLAGAGDHWLERWRRDHRLGHFRLGRRLGQGGMGTVYLARDTLHRRRVALKVIPLLGNADRARFLREARVMARLQHPNIVRIFEAGEIDGRGYLAMEPLTGRTLASRLRQSPGLPVTEVLCIADAVVTALAYMHERGIIHRDVKGANIFLADPAARGGGSARVRLMDFGLSRDCDLPTLTDPVALVGTLTHLAPEQLRGAPGDERADLYALGVVLYQCLTGLHPCADPEAGLSLHHLLSASPRALRSRRPDLPADLEHVVMTLLASRREERYASAEAASRALQRVVTDCRIDLATAAPCSSEAVAAEDSTGIRSGARETPWQQHFGRARRCFTSGRVTEAENSMVECLGLLKDRLSALSERDQQVFVERHDVAEVLEFMDELHRGAAPEGRVHES